MQNIIDKVFQNIINYFLINKKYKLYKIFFFLFKNLIKGPFILNFDDYIWSHYKKIEDNPCFAINAFLRTIKGQYSLFLVSNNQLFIKKNNLKN